MSPRLATVLLSILALNTAWFAWYSAALGLGGLAAVDPGRLSRVFEGVAAPARLALALHMIAGGVLTVGAPLQALPVLRRRWPGLHRRTGRVLVALALLTGVGGLVHIGLEGTVGGAWMSLWFAVYGGAMILAAASALHWARRGDIRRHSAWAVRLVILAVGSWIYRMHYVIWSALTDGAASNAAFTGLFDRVQVVAFFVPYLALAELALRRRQRPAGAA